jgi:DNA-binding transcriptional MerR regulator
MSSTRTGGSGVSPADVGDLAQYELDDDAVDLTIDELARRCGTTSRNIRAFQSLGALPHPSIVGRTAHYSGGHLRRLEAVLRLQTDGFSIASISALFDAHAAGRTLAQVLGTDSRIADYRPLRLISDLPSNLVG